MSKRPQQPKPVRTFVVEAVLRVQLGEAATSVARDLDIPISSLRCWIADYERPAADVIVNLLAELVVRKLKGDELAPGELSAIVSASKIVLLHSEGAGKLGAVLDALGGLDVQR